MHLVPKRQQLIIVALISALIAAVPVSKGALANPPNPLRNSLPPPLRNPLPDPLPSPLRNPLPDPLPDPLANPLGNPLPQPLPDLLPSPLPMQRGSIDRIIAHDRPAAISHVRRSQRADGLYRLSKTSRCRVYRHTEATQPRSHRGHF